MLRESEYPKQIDTIVQDIYKLFETPHQPSSQHLEDFANDLKDIIKLRLEEDPTVMRESYLRMSSIGKPDRQLWYSMRLENQETIRKIDGQNQLKFLFGDIIECLVLFLAKEAGHTVEHEQKTINVDGVEGHIDCVLDGVAADVKSASSWGFKKFKDGTIVNDDPFGYIGQISGYKTALEREYGHKIRSGFLAMNKENAELSLCLIPDKHTIDVPERIANLKEAFTKNTPPPRCYSSSPEANGNTELPKGCSWCPFKEMCWNDANNGRGLRVFKYATGPKFFTDVVSPPRVDEITNSYFKLPLDIED